MGCARDKKVDIMNKIVIAAIAALIALPVAQMAPWSPVFRPAPLTVRTHG